MPDFEKAKAKVRRRVEHQAAIGNKTHYYTSIPDPLNQAYIDGKVNDTLFRLVYCLLSQGRNMWITRDWLEDRFSKASLQAYLPAIKEAGIVIVDQVIITEGKHPANVYHTTHPDDWNMEPILAIPRAGQRDKRSQVNGRKRPNKTDASQSDNRSPVNGSQVNGSQVNGSQVNGIISTNANQTNLNQTNTNPPAASQRDAGGLVREVTLKELDGTLRGMYDKYANMGVIQSVIRRMVKLRSKAEVGNFLNHEARQQQGVLQWKPHHAEVWEARLQSFFETPQSETEAKEKDYEVPYQRMETLDDCPY